MINKKSKSLTVCITVISIVLAILIVISGCSKNFSTENVNNTSSLNKNSPVISNSSTPSAAVNTFEPTPEPTQESTLEPTPEQTTESESPQKPDASQKPEEPKTSQAKTEEIKAPSNLKISGVHETGAALSWSGNGKLYKIEISEDGKAFKHLTWKNNNKLDITNLKSDKKYWIRVYSSDADKNLIQNFASIDFSTKKISPIKSLNVSYITDTGAVVKWSGGTERYQIKISTNGTTFNNYISYTDKNSVNITKLKSETKYWVRIYNLDGNKSLTESYETIEFTTEKNITLEKKSKTYKSYTSSNLKDDYVQINILDNGIIEIEGSHISDDRFVSVYIQNDNKQVYSDSTEILSNKTYSFEVNAKLPEGTNELILFFGKNRTGTYIGKHKIYIYTENSSTFFKVSPIYEHNYKFYTENSYIKDEYLKSGLSSKDQQRIKDLAESITQGISSDYDKVKAISTWVSDNIYYNWDGYLKGKYGKNDAISVLDSKKSVCAGYANLTDALIKSINIPCKVVNGFALGVSTSGSWENTKHTRSNHAWNEAYVDGRWIIIDTTWNSRNMYEDGKFNYGGYVYTYFDPKLEVFSDDHKILEYI